MTLTPYINLTGNAEEAMTFYQGIFDGKIEIQRWSDMPPNPKMPVNDDWRDKVMHGSLTITDGVTFFLSDSWPGEEAPTSSNIHLHIEFDTEDQLRKVFQALSAEGKVNMPVDEMFWGAVYGDLVDKFGVSWGLHYQRPA